MNLFLRAVCLIGLGGLLSGCVTTLASSEEYRAYLQAPSQRARLIVYRYRSQPYLARTSVAVSGQTVKLPNDRFAVFDLTPGKHRVRVDWAWDTATADRELDISLRQGETRFVKIDTTAAPMEVVSFVGTTPIVQVGSGESNLHEVPVLSAVSDLRYTRLAP